MAEELNPMGLAQQMYFLQNPAAGIQMQQQQQLAQQMMTEGSQQADPNQMVSGHVVPMSPFGGLAKMGERIAGAYTQKQNNEKLAQMMQNGMSGASGAGGGITGNPGNPADIWMSRLNPEGYKAQLALMNAGPIKAAEQRNTIIDLNGHKTWGSDIGGNTAPPSNAPRGTGGMTQPQQDAAITSIYGGNQQPAAPATSGANTTPMSPQGNGGPVNLKPAANNGVDFNNPVEVKQRQGLIEGDQKYLNETLLPAKDAALAANSNISALQQAGAIANSNDLTHTGPTAPARLDFIKHINDFVSSTGGEPLQTNEIANADAINKIGLRLTANMTKMLGSREAAQIFVKIQEANPNWYMQPQTLNLVSSLIKAENDTAIGKYDAGFKEATRPSGLAQNGVNAYESQNPGMANVKKAFAASGMAGFDNPQDPSFAQLPKGSTFYDLMPNSPTYGKQLVKH